MKVEIKDYNVKIDGNNFFDYSINNDNKTYENIRKIATNKEDDYTTGCFLGCPYFKENYKIVEIDLSKQQDLDDDPRSIQQINFKENLGSAGNTTIIFITEEAKKNCLRLFTRDCTSIVNVS